MDVDHTILERSNVRHAAMEPQQRLETLVIIGSRFREVGVYSKLFIYLFIPQTLVLGVTGFDGSVY